MALVKRIAALERKLSPNNSASFAELSCGVLVYLHHGLFTFHDLIQCFMPLRRRFIWNFLRVENEHLSRLKGAADHSQEELREYDEDAESEENEE